MLIRIFIHLFYIVLIAAIIDVKNGIEAADNQPYLGCYVDQLDHRLLDGSFSLNLTNLTPSSCLSICAKRSYPYAGLEQGNACYCDYHFPSVNVRAPEADCSSTCSGDSKLHCGGLLRLSVYETGVSKNNARPRSIYLGCYKDIKLQVDQRNYSLLKELEDDDDKLTPNLCDKQCYEKGYLFFGLTMGSLCYCGDQPPPRSLLQSDEKCYRACTGDNSKKCGGKWEFSMYATGITDTPIEFNYLGCAKDYGNRITPELKKIHDMTNSPRRCLNICGQAGYAFGAVENGEKCYCSNGYPDASLKDTDKACDISPCPGNPVETCGDKERLKVYKTFINGIPPTETIEKFIGCYVDQEEHRILNGNSVVMDTTLTPDLCVRLCSVRGYPVAGVENGTTCYCGHQFPSKNVQTHDSMCNIRCSGNSNLLCGGPLTIAVYETGISKKNARPRSTYLGCYHDHKTFFEQRNNSLLKGVNEDYEEMLTPDFCDELCYKNGFLYFGMTIGRLCYCGDQKPPQAVRLPEEKCYTPCTGMPYKKCGGNWEFSMYSTGITNFPINGKYLGCAKNPSGNKLQPEILKRYDSTNSPRRCVNVCGQLGFKFSAVENGEYCYCSNGLPEASSRDNDSACNIVPCAGDANNNCGDKERLMIFGTYVDGIESNGTEKYLGCYVDQEFHRLLDGIYETVNDGLTPKFCTQLCFARGYPFAGLENGNICYCGYHFPSINVRAAEAQCNSACSGDPAKTCGGLNMLSAYTTGISVIDSRPRSTYLGCYRDNKISFEPKNHSLLSGEAENFDETLTPALCDELCYQNGFLYFGMTLGNYCYCGDQQPSESALLTDDKCYSNCLGESYYMCGGKWEFSIYSTGISDTPIDNNYMQCIKDDYNDFSSKAEVKLKYASTNSPRRCVNICGQLGYSYSGIKNENQCLCSNTSPPSSSTDSDSACNVSLCPGNPSDACGDKNRIKQFRTQARDSKETTKNKYLGCYTDQIDHRVLDGTYLLLNTTLTPVLCSSICFERAYPFAGTERGNYCYCGHQFPSINIGTADSECNVTCSGDSSKLCGGLLKIAVYETGITKINSRPRSTYLGCYEDHKPKFEEREQSILKGRWEDFDVTLTPKVCDNVCHKHGFLYFGMTIGKFCYCGDQKVAEKDLLSDGKCYTNCSGDSYKRCGGNWEFSVYSTGITDSPLDEQYAGCLKNPAAKPFKIEVKRKLELTNTPRRCANICQQFGYIYSGVENGETCYCSNIHPPRDALDDETACDVIPCPGDGHQTCGNKERIKIFRIRSKANETKDPVDTCEQSSTVVNGSNVCSETVIFRSNFTSSIDPKVWKYAVKMFPQPSYEFVVYDSSSESIYTEAEKLFIRPKLLPEHQVTQGSLNLNNCTGDVELGECSRTSFSFNILPPVKSAKISTENSFSFRYGILNMTMKLPSGDWIVPHIRLVKKTDPRVSIIIAVTRGNRNFMCNNVEMGSTLLEAGLHVLGDDNLYKYTQTLQRPNAGWSDSSHVFTLRWTPDYMSISVDEQDFFFILANDEIDIRELLKVQNQTVSKWYPFDDEFYLVIGVSVAGISDFPDGCKNNGKDKPWTNVEAKAVLRFWEDRNNWHKTWNAENSLLRIEHISITAL